jgi:hypothetical protein
MRHAGIGSAAVPGDAPEIVGRQLHPDDDHGEQDEGRHGDIYHRLE